MFTLNGDGKWNRVKLVRLSPVLTLLSCNGLICVLAFSLSSGIWFEPLKEFVIAVPAVRKDTYTHRCLFVTHIIFKRSFLFYYYYYDYY